MKLSQREFGVLSNALRVAKERFDEHAVATFLDTKLQDIFKRQAEEVEALYQRIANEEGVQS